MLDIDPVFDELLDAELIDQVRFTPSAEYAFRHPLIRCGGLRIAAEIRPRRVASAPGGRDPRA
jgi:hypothetical protein